MTGELRLREVEEADLPILFEHQLDAEANRMAAFTPKDPSDRDAFDRRWERIRADTRIPVRTIEVGGRVAGSVLVWVDEALGRPEVSYWIGREFWGCGVATRALHAFLDEVVTERPILARVAADNDASKRVLEKCGFVVRGSERGYANARGEEIEELILERTD